MVIITVSVTIYLHETETSIDQIKRPKMVKILLD